jgi:hypothetical protein
VLRGIAIFMGVVIAVYALYTVAQVVVAGTAGGGVTAMRYHRNAMSMDAVTTQMSMGAALEGPARCTDAPSDY